MLGGSGFDLPQIIVLIVAVGLVVVGISYRTTSAMAGRLAARAERLRGSGRGEAHSEPPDHSPFKRAPDRRVLSGRPNPYHVKTLGLVTWEAEDREQIESAFRKIRSELMARLEEIDPSTQEAGGLRERLRHVAEARSSLLGRIE